MQQAGDFLKFPLLTLIYPLFLIFIKLFFKSRGDKISPTFPIIYRSVLHFTFLLFTPVTKITLLRKTLLPLENNYN